MNHLARFKWFYAALGFWFFAAALSSWALIYSPFHSKVKKISEFSTEINGVAETNLIAAAPLPVKNSFEETSNDWKNDGWVCVTRRTNLAGYFLDLPPEDAEALAPLLQLSVFKKNKTLRLLGYLAGPADGQTYQWTAETSTDAVKPQNPSSVDFPLKPPPGSFHLFAVRTGPMAALTWSMSNQDHPAERFKENYISQGYSGRLIRQEKSLSQFILQKGQLKLFLAVKEEDKNCVFNLILPHR